MQNPHWPQGSEVAGVATRKLVQEDMGMTAKTPKVKGAQVPVGEQFDGSLAASREHNTPEWAQNGLPA